MSHSDFDLESGIVLESLRNRGGMSPEWADSLKPLAAQISGTLQRFQQETHRVKNSGEFTARGLQQRLTAIATEAKKALTTATAKDLSALRDRRGHAQRRMTPPSSKADDAARAIRAWELRTLLREEDPLIVETRYREAIRNGDHELIEAIHSAPRVFPLVADAVRTELTQVWLESQNPEAAREVNNLAALEETVTYLVTRATQVIDREAPADQDAPIVQAA